MKPKFKKPRIGNYLIAHGICQDEYIVVLYKVIGCQKLQTHKCISCSGANPKDHYSLSLQFDGRCSTGTNEYYFCPHVGLSWIKGKFHPEYSIVDKTFFMKYSAYLNLFFENKTYAIKL